MLRQGNVKLIGERFPQLALGPNPGGPTAGAVGGGAAGPLANAGPTGQLATQLLDPNAQFARIYGFSFEGHYYDLPRPVIMLVHGNGIALPNPPGAQPTIDQSDEAARLWEFSGNLRQWNYDKKDMSIRLDLDSGFLEDILLARALADRAGAYGAAVSGAGAYGGAAVSGAGAYGAGAYGAGAFGAGAFGAGAFGAGAVGRGRRGWD